MTANNVTTDVLMINPCHHGIDYYSPIGINMLATILNEAGYKVSTLDFQRQVISKEIPWPQGFFAQAEYQLHSTSAKIYCFTCMNVGFPWAVRLAKIIRNKFPVAKIVFGGPHVTLLGKRILEEYDFIDVVAINEGERIITRLIEALLNDDTGRLIECPNILFRVAGEIIKTTSESFIEDLDELPLQTLDQQLIERAEVLSVEAGRGCPYTCTFCSSHTIWSRRPRFKSADRLINEALSYINLVNQKNNQLLISYEHDDFLSNKRYFIEFAEKKISRGADFIYGITTRINHLNESIVDLLYKSKCVSVFMGLETGSQEMQSLSSKRLKITSVLPIISMLRERKIHVSANFIVGFPQETEEDVIKTFDLMIPLALAGCTLNISMMCPEPGSELGYITDPRDYVILEDTSYFKELSLGGINVREMSDIEICHLRTIANKHYDIIEMAWICSNFQELISELPFLTAMLMSEFNNDVSLIVNKVLRSIRNNERLDVSSIMEHCYKFISSDNIHSRFFEFSRYELARSQIKKNITTDQNFRIFGSDMPSAYFLELKKLSEKSAACVTDRIEAHVSQASNRKDDTHAREKKHN